MAHEWRKAYRRGASAMRRKANGGFFSSPSRVRSDSTILSHDSNTGMKYALGFCPTYHPNIINPRPAWLSGCTQARVYG